MTKEIPLSLQVFHSRNEYQAQKLNRTEQIRLRDLHDVLHREEKLYVKDYALHKQKFNSHYLRRRSEPHLAASGIATHGRHSTTPDRHWHAPASIASRSSLFSAPGKLQTNRSNSVESSLASRMCKSIGEIPTMSRFQRMQRKFSIASFTENGVLTPRGAKMENDIEQVREILFRNRDRPLPRAKRISRLESVPDQEEERAEGKNRNLIQNDAKGVNKTVVSIASGNLNRKTGSPSTDQNTNSDENSKNHHHKEDKEIKSHSPNITDNNSQIKSLSQNIPKKRVTIQWGNDVDDKTERGHHHRDVTVANDDSQPNTARSDDTSSREFSEWRSMLSRRVQRVDPLQQKINHFLSDQNDFNMVFPKGFDGVTKTSAVQKELANIGREKKEMEQQERARRNEIVLEVLNKLGIEDESILCNYQE